MATVFIGRCDSLRAKDLDNFDESSVPITNRTFRKYLGAEDYKQFEKVLGYGRGLRLSKDWHVSYSKGMWKGKPAICCFWSAYHHILIITGVSNEREACSICD